MEEKKDDRPEPVDFGEVIKKIRTDRKLTLKAAAELTGIAEAYLWQLENGKRESPRPETIKKLADGYGVPPQHLLACGGYLPEQGDIKKEVESANNKYLFRGFEKLSQEGKKKLESYLQFLQKEDKSK